MLLSCAFFVGCNEEKDIIDKNSISEFVSNSDETEIVNNETEEVVNENNNESEENELYFYAKVENASEYSNVVEVKLMMYNKSIDGFIELARGDWQGDGFRIALPKTVDPNYLYALINSNEKPITIIDPPSTLTISNKNVKVGHVMFLGVDKDDNMVTRFYPLEIDKDGNGQDAYYTYVDSDVTISGYTERMNATIANTEYDNARYIGINLMLNSFDKITTTYSVNWKKGWNLWSFLRFGNISENTATEKWTPICCSRLKWYSAEDLWIGNKNHP